MPWIHGHFSYKPQSLTKVLHYFTRELGIASREDLMALVDDHATEKQFELFDGIGPAFAEIIVWLRGLTIEEWEAKTGLQAFNTEPQPQPTAAQDWG